MTIKVNTQRQAPAVLAFGVATPEPSMLAALGVAVYTTDLAGRITYFNDTAAALWGREPALLQETWYSASRILSPDGTPLPRDDCPMAVTLREGISIQGTEVIIERPDGTRRNVRPYPSPIHNRSGKMIGAVNVLVDVTEARQSEEAMRQSHRLLARELASAQRLQEASCQLISDNNIQAIHEHILDAAIGVMRSDAASMRVLDETQDALRMLAWRGFDPSFGKAFELCGRDTGTSCSAAWQLGQRVIVPDVETCDFIAGTPFLQDHARFQIRAVQSTPLISRGGKFLGVISTHWRQPHQPEEGALRLLDVLARQAADLIERSQTEVALAESMAIKDHFVDLLSHELKGSISVIVGNGALLQRSPDRLSVADSNQCLDDLVDAAGALNRSIDNLLALARLEADSKLYLEPVDLARQVSNDLEGWLKRHPNRQVSLDAAADVPLIDGSPAHLSEVLENLLNNAHKYSPPGSNIEVVVRRSQANRASVRVLDRGIGFSEEQADKLFTLFYRSDPARKMSDGMGVGMTLCKRILEAQNGSIDARPRPGGGSEITFSLPALAVA